MLKEDFKIYKAISNKQIFLQIKLPIIDEEETIVEKGEPSMSKVSPYEYSQSDYTNISLTISEINKIIKKNLN